MIQRSGSRAIRQSGNQYPVSSIFFLIFMKKLKTYKLAVEFYQASEGLYLRDPLRNQFKRAVLSIVLNLAEGSAKPTTKDRRKFYRISLGSLREVQAILDITRNKNLMRKANILGGFLYKLCQNT